jgi:hypothetical protein
LKYSERHHALDEARDLFLRAAAALTEFRTEETIAFALLEGAIGLVQLAKADPEYKARDRVLEAVRLAQKEAKDD